MSKYMNWKWKSFMALVAAVNIMSLSGCSLTQPTSASSSTSSSKSASSSTTAKTKSSETTAVASIENIASTALGKPSIVSSATYELAGGTATKQDEDISAVDENKSAVKTSTGGDLTASGLTIVTTGKTSSDDESRYYGLNAGVLAEAGSDIKMEKSDVTTSGQGANGIFATGTNADIVLSKVNVTTNGASSRGFNTTYNGTINATNCKISTAGDKSPAVGNGVGGGTVSAIGGTLNTAGADSPAVYSTDTVNVTSASAEAKQSEAAVVDGDSSVTFTDVAAVSNGKNGVMLYQNNTAEASMGTSNFNMVAGSLTSANGALFYVTNTNAVINLNSVKITNSSDTLLSAAADSWGTKGSNGGNVTLSADTTGLSGNIVCDMFSTVNFVLRNTATYKGTINSACSGKEVNVTLDAASTWDVTGDSYVTAFTDYLTQLTNIKDNGNTIFYDKSNKANDWLEGKTVALSGGGKLTPDLSKGQVS